MISLLLAAGRGRRAGGPKAWLDSGGKSLLERQLAFLLGRRLPGEVFVSIQGEWLERCRALAPEVSWVPAEPDAPATDSLLRLLAAAPRGAWASAHHVDMPVWDAGLFSALEAAARRAAGRDAVSPLFEGRRGHPVLLSPAAQEELLARPPERLDHWLAGRRVEEVSGPWACCLENWNDGVPA